MFIEKSSLFAAIPPKVLPKIIDIVNVLLQSSSGVRVYLVGGAVRDFLLKLPMHDLDIEVHGLTQAELEKLLSAYGSVHTDGKSFGVLRLEDLPIDWSLPRRDSSGRKPVVEIDPTLDITTALRRRDLTMNAMAIDLNTGELVDPFGGYEDLTNHVLATPDPHFFVQDPLRFYRVMHFIGRFEMQPDAELQQVFKTMSLDNLSVERIHAEFEKLFMLSRRPSLGLRWLRAVGRLKEILPELAALIDVPQELSWHPEGDVFEHTMQACDAAVTRPVEDKKLLIIAALCHDLGKVTTTEKIDGRWRSFNHEAAGVEPAKKLCSRLTAVKKIVQQVALLVRHHMAPVQFIGQKATARAYKKLAAALAPDLNLFILAQLAYADKLGRNPEKGHPLLTPLPAVDEFMQKAQEYGVLYKPEPPLLTGNDVMELGCTGTHIGKALEKAYAYQIEQKNPTRETVLRYIQRMLK